MRKLLFILPLAVVLIGGLTLIMSLRRPYLPPNLGTATLSVSGLPEQPVRGLISFRLTIVPAPGEGFVPGSTYVDVDRKSGPLFFWALTRAAADNAVYTRRTLIIPFD